MGATIDFYFDFSSPYGYFAAQAVEPVAERHGRRVTWRPIMLGPIMQESGNVPLLEQPLKGAYARRDWARLGRYFQVPWVLPTRFPVAALAPARAFYWIAEQDTEEAVRFAKRVYQAYFGEGRDISDAMIVGDVANSLRLDAEALTVAVADPAIKTKLKAETAAAKAAGVCGSPYFIVDGEGFWGVDRLPMIDEWLSRGGW